ncbi:MmyB family transcriptional regulator [Actinoallomurus acaciae]|uniref:MmyB-like transcription regulator ligand binding domain-containing protein n=1 Tax=Actinoallomurus acaciae TaxID=502577 RepID=A0ABV5YPY2_9ACTN
MQLTHERGDSPGAMDVLHQVPPVRGHLAEDRNLLWLVFTDPYVRELLPGWEVTGRRFLAEFRAEAGPRLGEPSYARLIERAPGPGVYGGVIVKWSPPSVRAARRNP